MSFGAAACNNPTSGIDDTAMYALTVADVYSARKVRSGQFASDAWKMADPHLTTTTLAR
jgi:hypothetical protein